MYTALFRLLPLVLLPLFLLSGDPVRGFADFEQIRDLLRRGDFVSALRACDHDLKLRPRDFRTWTLKGIALQGVGRNKESLESFRRAVEIQPEFLPALQGAAQLEYQMRDPRCRQTLEAILRLQPDAAVAHAMLGVLAFERKDCAEAVEHFEKGGDGATGDPLIKLQLGTCYYQLERWAAAERQFSELLSLKEDARVRYNLGLTQVSGQKMAEAVATLGPLARGERPDPEAMSLLASAYEANKQTPEALQTLRRAIDLYPREESLYVELAALCLGHNAIPLGTKVLEAGARNIPRSARIRMMLGILHASAENFDEANAAFKEAERLAPDAAYGQVGLAITLMRTGGEDQMIHLLREQLKRTPDIPAVGLTLAEALLQKGTSPAEFREAESHLRSVIRRQPSQAKAHSLLGKVYLRLGEMDNAARSLEAAVRLDPSDRGATYQLMILRQRAGRSEEAAALKEKIRQLQEVEKAEEVEAGRYRLIPVPEDHPAP